MQHHHRAAHIRLEEPALSDVYSQLATEENVLCALSVDLDQQLCFAPGLLVLTNRRLLSRQGANGWSSWPLLRAGAAPSAGMTLHHFDHAGVGTLELHEAAGESSGRLASWRFTVGANLQAQRLVRLFARQQGLARSSAEWADGHGRNFTQRRIVALDPARG